MLVVDLDATLLIQVFPMIEKSVFLSTLLVNILLNNDAITSQNQIYAMKLVSIVSALEYQNLKAAMS